MHRLRLPGLDAIRRSVNDPVLIFSIASPPHGRSPKAILFVTGLSIVYAMFAMRGDFCPQ